MATRQPVQSRWWYGVAALPVAMAFLVLYLLTIGILLTQPVQIEALLKRYDWMIALVILAGFWSGILFVATGLIQLLFPVFLVLDIRTIRQSDCSWTPNWMYSLIAVPSVALFLFTDSWTPQFPTGSEKALHLLLYLLAVFAPLGYLYQRRRYVGVPFGERRGTEPSASTQTDSEDEFEFSDDGRQVSRWWYGVVIPPALSILGQIGLVRGAVWALFVFGSILLVPVFALSLFLDARAIARSERNWKPNPFVWGVLGLGPLVPLLLGELSYLSATVMVPLALLYLYRRNHHVGLR